MTQTPADLLAAYDAQLRQEAEVSTAHGWHRHGPLVRAVTDWGGFVTYRDLEGAEGAALDALIADTIAWFRDETEVSSFEWKSRGHDAPADLPERLLAQGLVADPTETVMIGAAERLDVPVDLPAGVLLRRAGDDGADLLADATAASKMQAAVFGRDAIADPSVLVNRLIEAPELYELWLAEDEHGAVVSAGRLDIVPGTEFGGLWGGAVLADWRGRGIYRAMVAARARSAIRLGAVYLHSDCTDMSRPILERSGLVMVTTTTPYNWTRP
ncbi:GNAT family N-acetyltransferase [Nocardioides sp. InS609-2]|uniref:GNAT family N-acetyltransferase n=1 Tax=Nocardioides sp. InS609-2 TaxID=2760705 RepID=UPI0020BDEBF3|nr:GNAT family N-acetyltransferase [Nocardioides sp. InS609-2]